MFMVLIIVMGGMGAFKPDRRCTVALGRAKFETAFHNGFNCCYHSSMYPSPFASACVIPLTACLHGQLHPKTCQGFNHHTWQTPFMFQKPCRTQKLCGVVRWRHLHQLRVLTVTSVAVTVAHALLCDISREAQYFDILVFIMTHMECITSQAFSWEAWGKLPFPRFHCDAAVVIRYVSQLMFWCLPSRAQASSFGNDKHVLM
ncbi:hypothetical protein JOM56_006835 [Amanita muscaria]